MTWPPASPPVDDRHPNGFLVLVGQPRRVRAPIPRGILVVGEAGHRCVVLSSLGHPELHRALVVGAENLKRTSTRTGATPFEPEEVSREVGRQLPRGYRMGRPRGVGLRDVHGTGRILFAALIGGRALDDEVDCVTWAPEPSCGQSGCSPSLADLPTMVR